MHGPLHSFILACCPTALSGATILVGETVSPSQELVRAKTTKAESKAAGSSASITFSTLGAASVDGTEAFSHNQWLATSFIGGDSANAVTAEGVEIKLRVLAPNQHLFVGIVGEASERPDLSNVLVEFDSAPVNAAPFNTVTTLSLAPTSATRNTVLQPDATYWLVVGATASDHEEHRPAGLYHWSYSTSNGPFESGQDWAVGSQIATGNTAGANWQPSTNTPYSFGISLRPIPEPTTASLLILSISGILLRRTYPA